MEATLRDFEAHASEYLRRALAGEEVMLTEQGRTVLKLSPVSPEKSPEERERKALERLRAMPWIRPGDGGQVRGADPRIPWPADEKPLSQLLLEDRE
jgi:prevent-host-death family protein